VYVYRDDVPPAGTGATGARSAARQPAEDDTSYWYDLLAEDAAPQQEEARGPFEPLLSSAGTPDEAGPAGTEQPAGPAREQGSEPPDQARARKLEQLKDLYLTAEAIGEQNVDKHFDQLLAQQRELISDYFKQPAAGGPRDGQHLAAEPEHQQTSPTGSQTTPPEGVSVRAEPPRAW
jgi:hypothetical protein